MKYSKECLACFNMIHHERHDVYFRYNKKKEDIIVTNQFNNKYYKHLEKIGDRI